jgi:hypothetical protein
MTLKISLPPEEEKKLADRAAAAGQDVSGYVHQLIRKDIDESMLAEILAPIHQSVRASGMTVPQVDALIDDAIAESRRERRSKRAS